MNGKPSKESQSLISELEEATLGDVSIKTVVPDDNENDAFSDDDEDLDDKFLRQKTQDLENMRTILTKKYQPKRYQKKVSRNPITKRQKNLYRLPKDIGDKLKPGYGLSMYYPELF